MTWIKRNLFCVIGVPLCGMALAVIGFAAFYANESRVEIRESRAGDAFPPPTPDPRPSTDLVRSAAVSQSGSSSDEIAKLTLRCRAVIPSHVSGDAETTIAYAMQKELQTSTRLFDPRTTKLGPEIHRERDGETFTFDVTLALNRPIK
jgi:hypothetical protein